MYFLVSFFQDLRLGGTEMYNENFLKFRHFLGGALTDRLNLVVFTVTCSFHPNLTDAQLYLHCRQLLPRERLKLNGQPRNSDRLDRTKQQASQAMCTNWWSDTGEVSKYPWDPAAKETFVYYGAETPSKVLEHSVDKWNKCKEESYTKGCYDCDWALHVCKSGSNEVCSLRFCSQQQELPINVKMFSKTLRLSPRIEFVFAPENELVKKAEVMKVVDIKKLAVLWTLISQFGRPYFSSRHNLTFGKKTQIFPRGVTFPEILEALSYAFSAEE